MKGYEYHKPQTVKEAIDLMEGLENAKYIAGGTDVMVLIRQKKLAPARLISLRNIGDLNYMETEGGLRIGSAVTYNTIAKNDFVQRRYSALADAVKKVGSLQIRNVATMGGNICNAAPSADTACPLLVLDASVIIAGKTGEREMSLDDFFLGPNKVALEKGEILKGFTMPAFGENTGSAYFKHTRRQAMDLPMLGVAARVTIDIGGSEVGCKDAFCTVDSISNILKRLEDENLVCEDVRIAMGVVAPRPIRARKAEEALKGKVISEKLFEEIGEIAASESQPRDSIRGEAWYRRDMVKVLTKRAILKAVDRVIRPDDTIWPDRLW
ncbi:MAG TPA: xanthine dehydrogenase family protein subunit M [Deltaproteobacteria bacterium]|nr:xanthine dehydrogenase family protein subunit M [Deltaproteobacteria bacterium]